MAPTMREIAEAVGVSVPTVSRVLRGTADDMVTAATRERILQVADDIGYHPNPHAQALVRGRASSIVLVPPSLSQAMNAAKTWPLSRALAKLQREVLIVGVHTPSSEDTLSTVLSAAVPEAVVVLTGGWSPATMQAFCARMRSRGIWPVLADPLHDPPADLPADVVVQNRSLGAERAVGHLIERGHRQIGLIAPFGGEARVVGYERALQTADIEDRYLEFVRADAPFPVLGTEGAQRLLRRHPEVTALFCASDLLALGAMKGIEQMGLRIPDDVAVVGFDDELWSAHLSVPLTTVSQPVENIAEATTTLLRKRLSGDDAPWQRVEVTPTLVVRESTGRAADQVAPVAESGEESHTQRRS